MIDSKEPQGFWDKLLFMVDGQMTFETPLVAGILIARSNIYCIHLVESNKCIFARTRDSSSRWYELAACLSGREKRIKRLLTPTSAGSPVRLDAGRMSLLGELGEGAFLRHPVNCIEMR